MNCECLWLHWQIGVPHFIYIQIKLLGFGKVGHSANFLYLNRFWSEFSYWTNCWYELVAFSRCRIVWGHVCFLPGKGKGDYRAWNVLVVCRLFGRFGREYGIVGESHTNLTHWHGICRMDRHWCYRYSIGGHFRFQRAYNFFAAVFFNHTHRFNRWT